MKRRILLGLGIAVLVVTTSCGPKRYGCNKRRCIATNQTEKVVKPTTVTTTKDA